jgi:hypothetical protein
VGFLGYAATFQISYSYTASSLNQVSAKKRKRRRKKKVRWGSTPQQTFFLGIITNKVVYLCFYLFFHDD